MTIEEFRKDASLVAQWKEALNTDGLLRLVVFDVMKSAHPARYKVTGDNNGDVSPTRAAIELGTTRGYSRYADTLEFLAVPIKDTNQDLGETQYKPAE